MEHTWARMKSKAKNGRVIGINAALFSAFFLGLAPIFGKQAIIYGLNPLGVVAIRTFFATLLLFIVVVLFQRQYLYIYPAGLIGCLLAGSINGIGSLFYYSSLSHINAGMGQLLYSLYPLFVAFWMFFDKQPPKRMTILRLTLALPAVYLLLQTGEESLNVIGVVQMLIASALYALHLPINQRVLYDIPAPTVTLYTLSAMTMIVVPVYLFSGAFIDFPETNQFVWPVIGLTLVTFFSRLTLFTGIKFIGGMQTALLGLSELLVTVFLSVLWLGEVMNIYQWIGALLLAITILLIGVEKPNPPARRKGGWFSWLTPASSDVPWHPGD